VCEPETCSNLLVSDPPHLCPNFQYLFLPNKPLG
jgi:hypothetical protein